ncbi:hypothetical protein LNTAR_15352 [Lentisphaera araneosa HTCC2155]|uniref:Uncharacterized protein n=1 Tax=Lentisphaera araneosa HTCC2155 TaxID=313628 RepID=A6DU55_9BACT|nr:hypothetical protein [Lentisphaera araneosa]EDM24814.1 hypothetical protein LNTAR_15352 [Lentisphaera araneosa HTCC2155]
MKKQFKIALVFIFFISTFMCWESLTALISHSKSKSPQTRLLNYANNEDVSIEDIRNEIKRLVPAIDELREPSLYIVCLNLLYFGIQTFISFVLMISIFTDKKRQKEIHNQKLE